MFEKMGKALTRTDIAEIEVNLGFTFPENLVLMESRVQTYPTATP